MTGRELVSASLRLIGAIASGETPDAAEATDGLAVINRMLDGWSNEDLLIYSIVTDTLTLTGATSYTMGTGGTFNTAWPEVIQSAYFRIGSGSSAVDYPITLKTESEYAELPIKGLSTTIAYAMYDDGGYPLRTLKPYPVPSSGTLVTQSLKPLTTIATLDTSISLPPGYEEAMIYNSAIRLSAEYGRPPNEIVYKIANSSKEVLKRRNFKESHLRADSALLPRRGHNFIKGDWS